MMFLNPTTHPFGVPQVSTGGNAQAGEPSQDCRTIANQVGRLNELTETLDRLIVALETKLGPILTPDPPQDSSQAAPAAAPRPLMCSVSHDLATVGDHLSNDLSRLFRLERRIEL